MQGTPTGIDKLFSKGFLSDKGQNQVPDYFADDVWNIRIKNGGITQRLGHSTIYNATGAAPQFIESINGELITCIAGVVSRVNYNNVPVDLTTIGSIGYTGTLTTIVYGKSLLIFTGAGFPRLYNGTTVSQLTAANVDVNVNTEFGTTFSGFTIINSKLNPNAITVSYPISITNPANAYRWTGPESKSITYDSQVLGMIGTMNYMWVFTEKKIEYLQKNFISVIGDTSTPYTVPLGDGYQLVNSRSLVGAGDMVFFMTKNKKIGTLKYTDGIATPGIDIISDKDGNSIDLWMQEVNIDDCVGMFDKKSKLVKFYVKSLTSIVNDICIIYDLENRTWLKDNNKYIGDTAIINEDIYSTSSIGLSINKDEFGTNDNLDGIQRSFKTTSMTLGNPNQVKQFRALLLAGRVNELAFINIKVFVDGTKITDKQVSGSKYTGNVGAGIGGSSVGGSPIGGSTTSDLLLFDFESVIGPLYMRSSGKKLQVVLSGDKVGQDILIDIMSIYVKGRKRYRIGDKI